MSPITQRRKTLRLLLPSTVSYAISGVLEYVFIQGMPVTYFFFLWSVGSICLMPLILGHHEIVRHDRNKITELLPVVIGSTLLVGFNVSLFVAYQMFKLAAVYPLIALSSMVFFFLDVALFSKFIRKATMITVFAGILIVVSGVYFVGGGGKFSFDVGMLPFVIAIPMFTGLGYYILSYNVRKYRPEMETASMSVVSIIVSTILFAMFPDFHLDLIADALVVVSGALYTLAVMLELKALGLNEQKVKSRNVVMKNYINNFTFLDTVLVLLGSVVIGSYTMLEIAGGALIVAGVVLVSFAEN